MKPLKLLLLFSALLGLLLGGCGPEEQPAPMQQPVTFYYRTSQTDFGSEEGVIRGEVRELGRTQYSDEALFRLYLLGPQSGDLVSPFSQDTELTSVRRSGASLVLRLTRKARSPAEFDHTLSYACLAKTALALDGVRKVQIIVSTPGGAVEDQVLLTENDILLYDDESPRSSLEITLYYADEEGRFLLPEKRTVPLAEPQTMALSVMELLLTPPQNGGMRSPLPPGTAVLDLSVENGLCSVDFNSDFSGSPPDSEQGALLAVMSVVNTLCELEDVNQVQLYVEGQKINSYVYLDLSLPWVLESAAVGPVREELGEFAGILCLPGQLDNQLHQLIIRARARGGASREEALLQVLFSHSPQNGLASPLFGAPAPRSIVSQDGLCTVDLASGTLPAEDRDRRLSIRSITATLCSLPEISRVSLLEDGSPVSDEPLSPQEAWYCSAPLEP